MSSIQTHPGALVAVAGTNASGKSGLAVELARRFGGEIVSADSRQIFTGLDLGSGKITQAEMKGVPHHLLDVCEAGAFFSMADYQRMAYAAIDDILARGRLPFLAGGTGLYVDSVTDGYVLSEVKPDLEYRAYLETFTTPQLYRMLCEQLPGAMVDGHNRNRVMRRLEKFHAGDPGHSVPKPRYRVLKLGVTWPREVLCERIDERLRRRMADGMLAEVQGLLDRGVSPAFLRKLGLEYRYLSAYLLGEIQTEDEMLDELSRAIKRFAKRQMTWFRRDKTIRWLDMQADPLADACAAIHQFLGDSQ
ncbi:MAG TPA: tRNA (adenosine(37)-N6)-dimethylallyltransferase MiaA [Candidatus Limiplasma sp.]|nr:tRNA (adenosine(37)-N6)-dimethylallyltransferase MiaA [Candidatus Limiplasma sp.]